VNRHSAGYWMISARAIALSAVTSAAVALRYAKPMTSGVDVAVDLTRITGAAVVFMPHLEVPEGESDVSRTVTGRRS
jgi:hypothetical protein